MVQLWDHQIQALKDIRGAFDGGFKSICYQLPTGGGKTQITVELARRITKHGKQALFVVHRRELLRQAQQYFEREGITKNIDIVTIQGLSRNVDRCALPQFLFLDEAHHSVSATYLKYIRRCIQSRVPILGVTATPERLDRKSLHKNNGGIFDLLIEGPPMLDLIEQGHLVRPRLIAVPGAFEQLKHKKSGTDFTDKELTQYWEDNNDGRSRLLGDVIAHYKKYAMGKPAIAFCISVKSAEEVAERFNYAGIPAASIDGKMGDIERAKIIGRYETGSIKVLCSCDLISEGFDVPSTYCSILLRPTLSVTIYLQQCGRSLRAHRASGKDHCIILDHADNIGRHGPPQEIRDWQFEGADSKPRPESEPSAKVKRCPGCYTMISSRLTVCPWCGHIFEPARQILESEGELVEITDEMLDELDIRRKRWAAVSEAKDRDDLIALAKSWGYEKPAGWAYHILKDRQAKEKMLAESDYDGLVLWAHEHGKAVPEAYARTMLKRHQGES